MTTTAAETEKLIQYLREALATERALQRVLDSQIAMTPRGRYRDVLEKHRKETGDHADRVAERLEQLGAGRSLAQVVAGSAQVLTGQVVATAKLPLDLLRGSSPEEKVLKNAKDSCAAEAFEIATYEAIEYFARECGDEQTAKLAARIRADEEQALAAIRRELPRLASHVVTKVRGGSAYNPAATGAGEAVRATAAGARRRVDDLQRSADEVVSGAADTLKSGLDLAGRAIDVAAEGTEGGIDATAEAGRGAVREVADAVAPSRPHRTPPGDRRKGSASGTRRRASAGAAGTRKKTGTAKGSGRGRAR
jgi:ferritin-like metal-binding protein YciE